MVERLTADQDVPGSNLGVPFGYGGFWKNQCLDLKSRQLLFHFVKLMDLIYFILFWSFEFYGGIAQW